MDPPPPPRPDGPKFDNLSDSSVESFDMDKINEEANITYPENVGYRQMSIRRVMELTFADEMAAAAEHEPTDVQRHLPPEVPQFGPVPMRANTVRYRIPTYSPPAHDVFGDGILNIFQNLLAKGCAVDSAHWLSYWLATEVERKSKLPVKYETVPYVPDVYVTEGTEDVKKLYNAEGMWKAAERLLQKSGLAGMEDKWIGMYVGGHQLRGNRHKQEDRFIAYPDGFYMNKQQDPIALLGVFDGHGGHECSHYAAAHMWEEWIKQRESSKSSQSLTLEQTLVESVKKLDERLVVRSVKEFWKGGSTAVCAAIDQNGKEIAFAWLGDSPAYIMNNMECRKITREHSPSDPEEARRVEESGGQLFVIGGELRVNGVLNLTRALGDVQGRPMISNEPESCTVRYDMSDYLVILVCDGVSDVLNVRQLYDCVEMFVREHPLEEYSLLSRGICDEAMKYGSQDNVTAVVGFLRPPGDLWNLFPSEDSEDVDESEEEDEETNEEDQ